MSLRNALRTAAALLAAGALGVAATGCGSSEATLDPVAQAADVTTHSGGSQIAMTVTVTAPGLSSPLTVKGNGTFNMAHKEGRLFLNLEGLPAAALSRLPSGPLSITELFKDGVIYISSPLFDGNLPGGAKWMKLDLTKFESGLGIDPSQLTSGQSDPTQYLQYLRSAGGSVKAVGHANVRGTPTTVYEGSIDLAKAAEALPSSDRAKLKQMLDTLAAKTGVSSIPVTVWIDAHKLIRRMSMKIAIPTGGETSGATVEYEMFGFGAAPAVTPPPSGETFDATKLSLQSLAAGG